jgi:hypothetical protein
MNYNIIWTPEKKERAIEKLTKYFEKHGPGECIMQNDDALIEAPDLLSDIADEILIEREGIVWEE